jgi:hypothetical protein
MHYEKMSAAIFILIAFVFMKRIYQWSRLDQQGERKSVLKINLICVAVYAVLLLLPSFFCRENSRPAEVFTGFQNAFLIALCAFIFTVHLFFFWIVAEIGMWTDKSERRKNHIQ